MRTISYPFRISPQGKVADTTDYTKIWVDRVRSVINTEIGDRVMRPTFGVDTTSAILNVGTPAESDLTSNIADAFTRLLPSVHLVSVTPNMDDYNQALDVEVVFTCPDMTTTSTTVTFSTGMVTQ